MSATAAVVGRSNLRAIAVDRALGASRPELGARARRRRGEGRHARFFAGRGGHVIAIDRDRDALAALAGVAGHRNARRRSSKPHPGRSTGETFDAIVVVQYLHRPLLPHLLASLAGRRRVPLRNVRRRQRGVRPSDESRLSVASGRVAGSSARTSLGRSHSSRGVIDGERPAVVQRLAAVGRRAAWPSRLSP